MRFSWWFLPLLVAAAAASGCSEADVGPFAASNPPGVSGPDATLRFDDEGTLELSPGELRAVTAIGSPPASYEMRFSLIGDAAGAFLDRTTVVAGADGHATVQLHAPGLASTFRLRATIKDGPSAEIGVAVSDKGFGTIRVVPLYDGQREIIEWTASVKAGTSCAEIAAELPSEPEGSLVATGAPGEPVVVESAPVGPSLAVAIRAGKAAWGCADVDDLEAGATRDVKVIVKDGPIDLASTSLDVTLAYTPNDELNGMLAATAGHVADVLLPPGGEAEALLDAMALAAPPGDQIAFGAERSAGQWDDLTSAHLASLQVPVRDACLAWSEAGLSAQAPEITGYLRAIDGVPGQGLFQVNALGAVDAADAGIPPEHLMSWTAEPHDVLRLAGALFWLPSRYVGASMWVGAQQASPATASMSEALAGAADCDALGTALGGYPGCDGACLSALCEAGLGARWQIALDASAIEGLVGGIDVLASGPGAISQDAAPIAWTADLIGTFTDGSDTTAPVTVLGQASAVVAPGGGPD